MSDFEERQIGKLTIRIDKNRCITEENCTTVAPEVFELDEGQVVTFVDNPQELDKFLLREACMVCPVDALYLFDEHGNQLVP